MTKTDRRDRSGTFSVRSRTPASKWLFATAFLAPGLALLGLLAYMVLAGIQGDPAAYVYFGIMTALVGGPFFAAGLYLLPIVQCVRVDGDRSQIVTRSGRPFLPKKSVVASLAACSSVSLTKDDVHETTSRMNLFGITWESDNYRRYWRVHLDGSRQIFSTLEQEQARRLAEKIGAAGQLPVRDATGKEAIVVDPVDLNLTWAERVARGDIDVSDIGAPPARIERSVESGARRYRGRSGGFVSGMRWDVRLEDGRLGLKVGQLGIGFRRWLELEEIELLRRDRRVRQVLRGARVGRREVALVRVVSDRRCVEIPLDNDEEADWLYRRLSLDFVEMTGR